MENFFQRCGGPFCDTKNTNMNTENVVSSNISTDYMCLLYILQTYKPKVSKTIGHYIVYSHFPQIWNIQTDHSEFSMITKVHSVLIFIAINSPKLSMYMHVPTNPSFIIIQFFLVNITSVGDILSLSFPWYLLPCMIILLEFGDHSCYP